MLCFGIGDIVGKIYFENEEIKTWEKKEEVSTDFAIKKNVYTVTKTVKTVFCSDIYNYKDLSVLITKEERLGAFYYTIVLFSDKQNKGWRLLSLNSDLDIHVSRITEDRFFVVAENKEPKCTSGAQISFCKLTDEVKVEEKTYNFSGLLQFDFFDDNNIIVNYMEVISNEFTSGEAEAIYAISIFEPTGSLVKTIFELKTKKDLKVRYKLEKFENGESVVSISEGMARLADFSYKNGKLSLIAVDDAAGNPAGKPTGKPKK